MLILFVLLKKFSWMGNFFFVKWLKKSFMPVFFPNSLPIRSESVVNFLLYFLQVAVGGSDGILHSLSDRLADLHKAIATVAAFPKSEESEADHIFENFHSSRTIRKLILDSPSFAETLWKMALEGKSANWAKGHR